MEIWAFRHPVSWWNLQQIHQGQHPRDPGLSHIGIKQARKIADFMKNTRIRGIWTSPLKRALDFAYIIAEYQKEHQFYNPRICIEPGLMEICQGIVDGMPYRNIAKQFQHGMERWNKRILDIPYFKGAETLAQVAQRSRDTFLKITKIAYGTWNYPHYQDDIMIIISHGITISLALASFQKKLFKDIIHQDNGSRNILEWDGKNMTVIAVNDTTILGKEKFTPEIKFD